MRRCLSLTLLFLFPAPGPAQENAGKTQTFVYKKTKEAELAIHVHFPPDWKKGDRRPGMVFFFGGGWTGGSVSQFEPQASHFATRGIVTARADYRVKSRHNVTPIDCVEDAKSAVRWLRTKADELGIDPDRIISSGGSAGGHIAACTFFADGQEPKDEDLKVSSKPNVLVLFNPVLSLEALPDLEKRLGPNYDKEAVRRISPTLHVKKDMPPTILFFGDQDKLVKQAEEFLARAKKEGGRAEISLAEGQGHGFFNRSPWRETTIRRADDFLVSLGYLQK